MLREDKIKPEIVRALKKAGWFPERKISIEKVKEQCKKWNIDLFKSAEEFIKEFGNLNIQFRIQMQLPDSQRIYKECHTFYDYSDTNVKFNVETITEWLIWYQDYNNDGYRHYLEKLNDFKIKELALAVGVLTDGTELLVGKSGKFYFAVEDGTLYVMNTVEEMINSLENRSFVKILED